MAGTVDVSANTGETSALPVGWGSRLALGTFVAVVVGAFAFYVAVGRDYWFRVDDWGLLIGRDGGDVRDLFHEQHDHWLTLPILLYRALWHFFGLNYTAYLVPVVAMHLGIAVLLRVIMRRAAVRPWTATIVAAAIVLLSGAGWNNIVWSFQVGFTASLVFGLVHLLLADHDGPFDRRDGLGLAFGLAGLMCSGVGITMVIVVGIAVLIRRGWRLALAHVAPLAAAFLAWYLLLERRDYVDSGGAFAIDEVVRFTGRGVFNAFEKLIRLPGGAILLVAVLVIGLTLAWKGLTRPELRRCAAAPTALLAGVPIFLVMVGVARGPALTSSYATTSRFVHVVAVLSAVAFAIAIDALSRRWWPLAPFLGVLLIFGMMRNVHELWSDRPGAERQKEIVLAVPSVPAFDEVPGSVHPFAELLGQAQITVAWLRQGIESDRIEPLKRVDARLAAFLTLRLAVEQRHARVGSACSPMREQTRRLEVGDRIDFLGAVIVQLIAKDGTRSEIFGYSSVRGKRLVAMTGPLTLRLTPYPGQSTLECR